MRREKEKGLTFFAPLLRTPCRVRARIPGIHRAGGSDLESNQSPALRTARISWTGGLLSGIRENQAGSWIKKKILLLPPPPLELSFTLPLSLAGRFAQSNLSRRLDDESAQRSLSSSLSL
jgi:hypothetical protein